ncbi:hypothetical protein [Polaribacter sp. IC073]|uniref:hypothetical protein n=1 Tax=Polaribacter sp. IC073 TaxID=2508540 RepID=UPI0011BF03A6|nr:hypothetical protein [Polaribacter sp. IC073]TXD49216.1 hypothetical protein ES045_03890 [Polaribacter sp. IC073]
MLVIEEILSELKFTSEIDENEYVNESKIYEFVIEKMGYHKVPNSLTYFYKTLAANTISK